MGVRTALVCASIFFLVTACTSGHCRRKADPPAEAKALEPQPDANLIPSPGSGAAKGSSQDRIFVYKYDGSLQCGTGKAISPEVMGKELQGIPVISATKKSDGLMHIQVCGSITGQANVFEIPAKFLKQAETKGFKKWGFE